MNPSSRSSIAKAVAKDTGYIYVDTGALYRAVAQYTLEKGVSPDDTASVVALLDGLEIKLAYSEGVQKVISQGNDVSGKIRTPEVSMAASYGSLKGISHP